MIIYKAKNFRRDLVESATIHESGGRFHLCVKGRYGDYQTSDDTLAKIKRNYSQNYGGGNRRVQWEKNLTP